MPWRRPQMLDLAACWGAGAPAQREEAVAFDAAQRAIRVPA